MFRFLPLTLLPFLLFSQCDDYLFVTIPKSGSNFLARTVLPILTDNNQKMFLHTWSYGDVLDAYRENPDLKGLLVIRQPEDGIYSMVRFMDKKVVFGDQTPEHHRIPQSSLDAWSSLSYEEKCMQTAVGWLQHINNTLDYVRRHEPHVVRYEDITNPKTLPRTCRLIGWYLNTSPVTEEKLYSILYNLHRPVGWVYRSGKSGEGKKELPKKVLEFISNDPSFQEFKHLFRYK